MAEKHTDPGHDDGLEAFFAAARREAPDLPKGLEERILADAAWFQAGYARPRRGVFGLLRQALDNLGGWPAAGGLAAACAAGIWIGFAPPSFLPDPLGLVVNSGSELSLIYDEDTVDLIAEEGA